MHRLYCIHVFYFCLCLLFIYFFTRLVTFWCETVHKIHGWVHVTVSWWQCLVKKRMDGASLVACPTMHRAMLSPTLIWLLAAFFYLNNCVFHKNLESHRVNNQYVVQRVEVCTHAVLVIIAGRVGTRKTQLERPQWRLYDGSHHERLGQGFRNWRCRYKIEEVVWNKKCGRYPSQPIRLCSGFDPLGRSRTWRMWSMVTCPFFLFFQRYFVCSKMYIMSVFAVFSHKTRNNTQLWKW